MPEFLANNYETQTGKNNLTYRINPRNGDTISVLGFGCMRLPMQESAPLPMGPEVDEAKAIALLDYAYQNGVNYFDTAWPYHQGVSETVVGKALKKYPRESFKLTDKIPGFLNPDKSKASEIFNEQLRRCQVEYFDYYLCHSLLNKDQFIDIYERGGVLDFLFQQKEKGRIRNLGWSFHGDMETLDHLLGCGVDWDVAQLQLNYHDVLKGYITHHSVKQLLTREPAQPAIALERLVERKIPVIVMEPLLGGRLGNLTKKAASILQKANPTASVASWAFRFVAGLSNILTVLSGMNLLEHLQDNMKAYAPYQPLTKDELAALNAALDVFASEEYIPCTGCGYCVPCPADINIPWVFKLYNRTVGDEYVPPKERAKDSKIVFDAKYEAELKDLVQADNCLMGGECMNHCPQGITVPDRMTQISKYAERLGG
jgi:predicted aldo/keto reductase-like oxidoreductase